MKNVKLVLLLLLLQYSAISLQGCQGFAGGGKHSQPPLDPGKNGGCMGCHPERVSQPGNQATDTGCLLQPRRMETFAKEHQADYSSRQFDTICLNCHDGSQEPDCRHAR